MINVGPIRARIAARAVVPWLARIPDGSKYAGPMVPALAQFLQQHDLAHAPGHAFFVVPQHANAATIVISHADYLREMRIGPTNRPASVVAHWRTSPQVCHETQPG